MHFPRHRTVFIFFAALAVLLVRTFTDSDGLFKSAAWLIELCTGIVIVTIAHWARKAYLDYGDDTDMRKLFARADPGRALIAIAIFFLAFVMVFSGRANAQSLELQLAAQHLPGLKIEVDKHWPQLHRREYVAALVSHESACPHPRKCWSTKARLKSAREEGAGLGQVTRAYRKDGGLRFDKLAELVDQYPDLRGWSWANVYDRPDLQLRALVLMTRDGFQTFIVAAASPDDALAFADAGYNGGNAGVQKERRACNLAPGCDPARWFGHTERFCLKSTAAIYGQRSPCDINRHHVADVFARMPRYAGLV